MDKTVKWFEDVLGWYGDVYARDSVGNGEAMIFTVDRIE